MFKNEPFFFIGDFFPNNLIYKTYDNYFFLFIDFIGCGAFT